MPHCQCKRKWCYTSYFYKCVPFFIKMINNSDRYGFYYFSFEKKFFSLVYLVQFHLIYLILINRNFKFNCCFNWCNYNTVIMKSIIYYDNMTITLINLKKNYILIKIFLIYLTRQFQVYGFF